MPEMDPTFQSQFELIREAYARRGIPIEADIDDDGVVRAIYAADRILVRASVVEEVRELFGEPFLTDADEETIGGLKVLHIGGRRAADVVESLNARFQRTVAARNHILSITPVGCCPAAEPEVPGCGDCVEPCPPPRIGDDGHDVRVGVSDTGLLADSASHSWLRGVTGVLDPLGPPDPATNLPTIPQYASHGTFIAGVVRCVAPGADVTVLDHFPTSLAGASTEAAIVLDLRHLLDDGVDVISLSAGGTIASGIAMLAFEVFAEEELVNFPDVVIVAAAGNNGNQERFYPAAFEWTLSVGALGADGQHRAWFSNFSPPPGDPDSWVDVYAPGEALVNAFASGLYRYDEPPKKGALQTFTGMARWSGTSFSTPLVAGLIAGRMTARGETAKQAAAALKALAAAQTIPGVGPVLYPPT
jgi:subtilisin family serine protease